MRRGGGGRGGGRDALGRHVLTPRRAARLGGRKVLGARAARRLGDARAAPRVLAAFEKERWGGGRRTLPATKAEGKRLLHLLLSLGVFGGALPPRFAIAARAPRHLALRSARTLTVASLCALLPRTVPFHSVPFHSIPFSHLEQLVVRGEQRGAHGRSARHQLELAPLVPRERTQCNAM